tara:strand:+ start:53 stop:199 length:147 start_codon:yes stop_codon:yes gene_type:complete
MIKIINFLIQTTQKSNIEIKFLNIENLKPLFYWKNNSYQLNENKKNND